jgi:hypothetical protein
MNITLKIFKVTFISRESSSNKSLNIPRKKMEISLKFGKKTRMNKRLKGLNFKSHKNSYPSFNLQGSSWVMTWKFLKN